MPIPSDLPTSVISHIFIGTNDYPRARAFYDAVLGTRQIGQVMEHGESVAYGLAFFTFYLKECTMSSSKQNPRDK